MEEFNLNFKKNIESFDLYGESRRLLNKIEESYYDYRLNVNMDEINTIINMIVKKIKDTYIVRIMEYQEKLNRAIEIANENERFSIIMSAVDDAPKIDIESIVMQIFEDTLYNPLKRIAMSNDNYQFLPREIQNHFYRFIDSAQENINLSLRNLKKNTEDIAMYYIKTNKKEFSESKRAMPTELIGIFFDDQKGCFWTEYDGKQVLIDLKKSNIKLDNNTYFDLNMAGEKNIEINLVKNDRLIKSLSITDKNMTYKKDDILIENNYDNNTISISSENNYSEYDIDNMDYLDRRKFDMELNQIDKNVYNYYNKLVPRKKLESLFI